MYSNCLLSMDPISFVILFGAKWLSYWISHRRQCELTRASIVCSLEHVRDTCDKDKVVEVELLGVPEWWVCASVLRALDMLSCCWRWWWRRLLANKCWHLYMVWWGRGCDAPSCLWLMEDIHFVRVGCHLSLSPVLCFLGPCSCWSQSATVVDRHLFSSFDEKWRVSQVEWNEDGKDVWEEIGWERKGKLLYHFEKRRALVFLRSPLSPRASRLNYLPLLSSILHLHAGDISEVRV